MSSAHRAMVVGLRGHFRQDRPAQTSSACIAIAVKLASIGLTPEVLFCYAVDYRKDAMCSCDTSGIAKLGSNMIISDIETLKRWQRLNLPGIHSDAGGALMRALMNSKESCLALESFYRVCNIEPGAVGEALSNFLAQGLIEIRRDDKDGSKFNVVPTPVLWARLAHYCAEMTTLLDKQDDRPGESVESPR